MFVPSWFMFVPSMIISYQNRILSDQHARQCFRYDENLKDSNRMRSALYGSDLGCINGHGKSENVSFWKNLTDLKQDFVLKNEGLDKECGHMVSCHPNGKFYLTAANRDEHQLKRVISVIQKFMKSMNW